MSVKEKELHECVAPLSEVSSGAGSLSAEIRFWWPNRQTAILRAWLEEKGISLREASKRTDIYILTGSAAVNLKQRDQNRFEAKTLVQKRSLAAAFAGEEECEIWIKHELPDAALSGRYQISVGKTRWLAYLDERGQFTGDRGNLSTGCQIELSEVQPDGQHQIWTSFSLEAFGHPDLLVEGLSVATGKLGDLPCAQERPLVASYAEWLCEEDYFGLE